MNPETLLQDEEIIVYLGVGANLGDRKGQILRGLARLEEMGAVSISCLSSFYETEPVGWEGGPWYLNVVAGGRTGLEACRLLGRMKEVEREIGRQESERNAPRPVDMDLLLYGRETICQADLVVPHPRMLERAFVLWPLAEIAPEVEISPGLTSREAASRLRIHEAIHPWHPEET